MTKNIHDEHGCARFVLCEEPRRDTRRAMCARSSADGVELVPTRGPRDREDLRTGKGAKCTSSMRGWQVAFAVGRRTRFRKRHLRGVREDDEAGGNYRRTQFDRVCAARKLLPRHKTLLLRENCSRDRQSCSSNGTLLVRQLTLTSGRLRGENSRNGEQHCIHKLIIYDYSTRVQQIHSKQHWPQLAKMGVRKSAGFIGDVT